MLPQHFFRDFAYNPEAIPENELQRYVTLFQPALSSQTSGVRTCSGRNPIPINLPGAWLRNGKRAMSLTERGGTEHVRSSRDTFRVAVLDQ